MSRIEAKNHDDLRAKLIRAIGWTKQFRKVSIDIWTEGERPVGTLDIALYHGMDRNETYTWVTPKRDDVRSIDPLTGKLIGISHLSDEYGRRNLKPGRKYVDVRSACTTVYKVGPTERAVGFVGKDNKIYIGRDWRYDNHGHYDNTDNTLTYLSDNGDIFYILNSSGGPLDGYSSKTIAEFKRLRKGPLAKYSETKSYTLNGVPLDPPKKAPARPKAAPKKAPARKPAAKRVQSTFDRGW